MSLSMTRTSSFRAAARCAAPLLFLRAVGLELRQVRPEILDLLVVANADEGHARARHRLHRVLDVLDELFVVPGDAGILVHVGIVEALERPRLAAVDAVERRSELDLRVRPDVVAGHALAKR